jgi:hypothetical protein
MRSIEGSPLDQHPGPARGKPGPILGCLVVGATSPGVAAGCPDG